VATPTPTNNSPVLFDASASCAVQPDAGVCSLGGGTITGYSWSFGDGSSGSGRTASHTYTRQQTFLVTLTVTNDRGVTSVPFSLPVQIGAGSLPTASFTSSPTAPVVGGPAVQFDGSASKPGIGHTIAKFVWNWGDGGALFESAQATGAHRYIAEGSYVVTLNVTDESGQTGTVTATVKVAVPTP
jgi:PKD repeat protein